MPLDAPEADPSVRASLSDLPLLELQKKLLELAPERAKSVDMQNPRRVARAIEIAFGGPRKVLKQKIYDVTWIGLALDREKLKGRIHTRLLERLNAGMLDEARALHAQGLIYERMEALGLEYRYMARHLQGLITYEEMVVTLESEIFKYAKRQMTWFKRNTDIRWLEAGSPTLLEQALALFA
jgi:tRNA dimethylallyltransferase